MKPSRVFVLAIALIAFVVEFLVTPSSIAGPYPTTGTLAKENCNTAKDILPPEILANFCSGGYRNDIAEWPLGKFNRGQAFQETTEKNASELRLGDDGTIVDSSGKQPPYIFGTPFPRIDKNDPQAGVKVIWNYFYGLYSSGDFHNEIVLTWSSPSGIDRSAVQDVYFKYYDGIPPDMRKPNPQNLNMQFLASALKPADLYGTTALTWRFRESNKRDNSWAYVPALRRVRALSPANRSDGFLGSDMSQDDGPFFDGKPQEFDWKLVGEQESYRLTDPYRLAGIHKEEKLPGGGWKVIYPDIPMLGFEDKTWTGLPWASVGSVLSKRTFYVVEGTPKDRYYLYGKIQLWFDKETFQGAWNRKFSWQGELLNSMQVSAGPAQTPDGVHYFDLHVGGGMVCQIAENLKLNRATVAAFMPGNPVDEVGIPLEPSFFNYQTLYRFGK